MPVVTLQMRPPAKELRKGCSHGRFAGLRLGELAGEQVYEPTRRQNDFLDRRDRVYR